MQSKAFPPVPSLPDKPSWGSSADKMKSCLTIFGEEGPSWLWQSVELGPFLCMQGSVSGEMGRVREECGAGLGRGVHREAAAPWPEVSWHRRWLVGAPQAVFSFFRVWLENRRGTKPGPRAGRRQRRRVCKHRPKNSTKAAKIAG